MPKYCQSQMFHRSNQYYIPKRSLRQLSFSDKVTKKSCGLTRLLDIFTPYNSNMITFFSVKWVPVSTASRGNEVGEYKSEPIFGHGCF